MKPEEILKIVTEAIQSIEDESETKRMMYLFRRGMVDGVRHTLEETGKKFGVSRERIRMVEAKVAYKVFLQVEFLLAKLNNNGNNS